MKPIKHGLVSTTEIGFDGRIHKEPTFLGAMLIGIVLFAGIGALLFLFAFL